MSEEEHIKANTKKASKMKKEKSGVDGEKSPEKKAKKKDNDKVIVSPAAGTPVEHVDSANETKSSLKKKKKKKDPGADVLDSSERSVETNLAALDLKTPPTKGKKKKSNLLSPQNALGNASDLSMGDTLLSPSKVTKFTSEYFEALLEETRGKLDKRIKIDSAERDKFCAACDVFYNTWYTKWESEQRLQELEESNASEAVIDEARTTVDEYDAGLRKAKKKCIKAALKIFGQLDGDKLDSLEDKLVKGAIIAQSGSKKLAKFAEEGKENEKLIKKLFNDPELMRDMLRFGGPIDYNYGNAIKIYSMCVETIDGGELDPKWEKVNKKIALACALELAAGVREFDSAVEIDAVNRYKHFEQAHRKGELDPAFPHFSVWEMRQIVNCDAPQDQMKWIRDTVMNYSPHITLITDSKLRYTYMLESDVRIRKPTWTGSPRTYEMILSGGGNQSINSWFARFLLKSFGLPAWGAQERRVEGFCRWTPDGWEAMNGAKWETCSWQGKSGQDFKVEIEARNKAPQQEYWKKLVVLQTLADLIDGDPNSIPVEEKDVLHPERFWRSLSIVSMELLFQTEPDVKRTFERKGRNLVKTRIEKYLEMYELDQPEAEVSVKDGVVTIPAGRHGYREGNITIVDSSSAGKQVNFLADGIVEYEIPDNAPAKQYSIKLEVCTVSAKQTPLTVKVNDSDDLALTVRVPYTKGVWEYTAPVQATLAPGAIIRLSRPKGSMGLAVKKIVLS
jgi:hypothetical protein